MGWRGPRGQSTTIKVVPKRVRPGRVKEGLQEGAVAAGLGRLVCCACIFAFCGFRVLLLGILESSDLFHQLQVGFVHIGSTFGGRFEKRTIEHFRHLLAFLGRHTALRFQVTLVANDNHGVCVHILHVQDGLTIFFQLLETLAVVHSVDDQETLASTNLRMHQHVRNQEG